MGIKFNFFQLVVDNENISSQTSAKTEVVFPCQNNKHDLNRALMKRKFRDIFWNSTTLNSYVYQEDQQNLRMSTYRLPEILVCLVNVQQDIFKAENFKGTVGLSYDQIVINIPKPTNHLFIHVLWQANYFTG